MFLIFVSVFRIWPGQELLISKKASHCWLGILIRSLLPRVSWLRQSFFLLIYTEPPHFAVKELGMSFVNMRLCNSKQMALWKEKTMIIILLPLLQKYTITTYITLTTKSKAQQMICMNCWSMTVHFFSCKSLSLSPPPIFLIIIIWQKQNKKRKLMITKQKPMMTLTKKTGDNWHWIF